MNDNYAKFEFEIQFLYTYYESNGDSVYTISIYKIYSFINAKYDHCNIAIA